jgi:Mu transposase, C-terminal./integrase core domain
MKVINTWQNEEALRRYTLIAPLLDADMDNGKRIALRHKIAEDNGTTVRTLYCYEKAFKDSSFGGLKPQSREKHRSQKLPANFDELVAEAIQLRREVPERSVEQIIFILELEHRVAPGVLKRSTLERHLYAAGFGREHLRINKDARKSSSKRFCKPHRKMLLQGDIKYGPRLPI